MAFNAFYQNGGSVLIASSTTTTVGVQASTGSIQGLMLTNLSTNDAYISISGSSTATAVLPTTASSTGSFPLLQRTSKTLSTPPNPWVSCITSAGTASVAVTPGMGL